MKEKLLLLLFVLASFSRIVGQTISYCYPDNAAYNTGFTTGISFTHTSEIRAVASGGEKGWVRFNTAAIPDGNDILSVELGIYISCSGLYTPFRVMPMESATLSGIGASVYTDAGDTPVGELLYKQYNGDFPDPN